MPPKTTIWKLEPHTLGKHLVLRAYLDAWLPILGRGRKRILFIDGFAGPGEYIDGEEGSPLIALNSLSEHQSKTNIDATRRFEEVEGALTEVTNAYDKLKKGAMILGSLLVANFVRDFYEYLQILQ